MAGSTPQLDESLKAWGVRDPELRHAALRAIRERTLSSVEVVQVQYEDDPSAYLRKMLVRAELRRFSEPRKLYNLLDTLAEPNCELVTFDGEHMSHPRRRQ